MIRVSCHKLHENICTRCEIPICHMLGKHLQENWGGGRASERLLMGFFFPTSVFFEDTAFLPHGKANVHVSYVRESDAYRADLFFSCQSMT